MTLLIFFVRLYFRKQKHLKVILEERCKLPYRLLGRAQDADDFGEFLMKLDPYNYMVLQTCFDGAEVSASG